MATTTPVRFRHSRKVCRVQPALDLVEKLTAEGIRFGTRDLRQGEGALYEVAKGVVEVLWFPPESGALSKRVRVEDEAAAKRRARRERTYPDLEEFRALLRKQGQNSHFSAMTDGWWCVYTKPDGRYELAYFKTNGRRVTAQGRVYSPLRGRTTGSGHTQRTARAPGLQLIEGGLDARASQLPPSGPRRLRLVRPGERAEDGAASTEAR